MSGPRSVSAYQNKQTLTFDVAKLTKMDTKISQAGHRPMRILVACEESQAVCKAFRAKGHEAYSCDLQPCSGGHEEWHLQCDVTQLLKLEWDMIIAFPPCTHLAVSGAAWFEEKRKDGRQQEAIDFFLLFAKSDCKRVAIENPVGIISGLWRKPDQIIHPWQFGHPEQKATCLWLRGLPLLLPTDYVRREMMALPDKEKQRIHYLSPGPDRAKERSKTFIGIAHAMADQWGNLETATMQPSLF